MAKIVYVFIIVVIICETSWAQTAFDAKLNSLYRRTVPTLSPEQVQSLCEQNPAVIILDTRQLDEFNVSHLAGAQFVDYQRHKPEQLKGFPKTSPIVVYCSVGYRSERVGEELKKLGYRQVYNLYGGIFEWKNRGLPVVNRLNQPTDSVHAYNKNWSKWLLKGIKVY